MCISEKDQVLKYIPAQLRENKEWYVLYYVVNPATNKLHIKKIKLNRVASKTERRKWGRKLVNELNIKLAAGWNPFLEQEAERSYHKLFDVFETYLKSKRKELRPDSMRSYYSYIKILRDYIIKKWNNKELYIMSFDKNYALSFMKDLYLNNKVNERGYNNYITFFRAFFNWCIQYNYCKINPFIKIEKKKEKQKKRILIDTETKAKLKDYLEKNNYEYFIICMLAHYALMRPTEITYMKIKDINMDGNKIFISGKISKNGKDRIATIPDVLKEYLEKMNLQNIDKDLYLFTEGFKPGKNRINQRIIGKYWDKLRKILDIPMEMQFYSLRDSGITQMFDDGVPATHIRDQADHSSLEVTNIYSKFANNNISQEIKKKCKEF